MKSAPTVLASPEVVLCVGAPLAAPVRELRVPPRAAELATSAAVASAHLFRRSARVRLPGLLAIALRVGPRARCLSVVCADS